MSPMKLSYGALVLVVFGSLSCLGAISKQDEKMVVETDKYVQGVFADEHRVRRRDIFEEAVAFLDQHPNEEYSLVPDTMHKLAALVKETDLRACFDGSFMDDVYFVFITLPSENSFLAKAILSRARVYQKGCEPVWMSQLHEVNQPLDKYVRQYLDLIKPLTHGCAGTQGFKCLIDAKDDLDDMALVTLKAFREIAKINRNQGLLNVFTGPKVDRHMISESINLFLGKECALVLSKYKMKLHPAISTFNLLDEVQSRLSEAFWEKAAATEYCHNIISQDSLLSQAIGELISEHQ